VIQEKYSVIGQIVKNVYLTKRGNYMADKDIIVTFAPCSEKDLQKAKEIFNGYIVRKVLNYIYETFPPEEQDYIKDEYVKFLKKKVKEKEQQKKVAQ